MTEQEPTEQDWINAAASRILDDVRVDSITIQRMEPYVAKSYNKDDCFVHVETCITVTREEALAEMRKRTDITVSVTEIQAALRAWVNPQNLPLGMRLHGAILSAKRAESKAA